MEKGDVDGNYSVLKLLIEGYEVLLCNIYGPNNDTLQLLENIQTHISMIYNVRISYSFMGVA